eukprot:symbB.v1.2.027627.t2/scaffold2847.1/size68964/5
MWQQVARATSLEELQIHLERFTQRLAACSATWPLQMNELHRLLLASLLHAGEQPARVFADAAVLLFGGTLLERLYGARFLLLLLGSSTMLSNAMALTIHQYFVSSPEGLSSTSGALVALGSFLALRHPRWAIWPGIPIPVSWLMAPVLVVASGISCIFEQNRSSRRDSRNSRRRRDSRDSRSPRRSHGRRSRSRRRSPDRSRNRGLDPVKEYRIPPPKSRMDPNAPAIISDEQKAASIEIDGYLYSTIDFTPPVKSAPWTTEAPLQYDYQTKSDISVTRAKTLPKGWELVKGPPSEIIKEKVIKIYPWGTHLLVTEGGNAYWTHAGDNPGSMEAIWDYDKYPGRYQLKPRYGRVSTWHGTFLIKTVNKITGASAIVADLSLARAYFRDLSLYRSSEKATKQKDEASGLQPSVALAACMAVEDCARRECRPPPADVVSWRMELEAAANEDVLVPEATLWADISGLILGLCAVGLSAVWPA